ncbi:putative phosphotransferase KNAG_0H03260 [Huiozyma naganishii CBS 8797]|uniref:Carbohydrate kinase FGGY C-terminal domain-containing protein n=1 Tax=Huiozyma naganishii (strain ATCC MYA-139 / BCRC 22969 / CBS 8797 / KCTC 17520 / NBRC 10181 / NCYC 3082 / Yp74L-3) TaxID=1071383 RepID=J7S9V8_HUIN7|nr:hypothetical protein KNAG_0H03260 [Kazachstania naganishii CBS 8797]CCK71741.1 hypothetical protein KNAG_0H03260 [Kazachstania naganishii CBS 8797]
MGEAGYYIGVDVGTGSARAVMLQHDGAALALEEHPIKRQELRVDFITQSSSEIWSAVCHCVRGVVTKSGVNPRLVKGIGFDATCSLVAVDAVTGDAVPVGPNFDDSTQNIILWMDHRATRETDAINATGDRCLKYVGGQMSVEMELPKIKWLKGHMPRGQFTKCKFFDLPDYLTFMATAKDRRSFCSAVCKQGLLPPGVDGSEGHWSPEFLEAVGLSELIDTNFVQLGGTSESKPKFLTAGQPVGQLTLEASEQFGLSTSCIVASGVIDAYAGWIGSVGAKFDQSHKSSGLDVAITRLALIAGTSTCHIMLSKGPQFVPGVWGPYRDVLIPGYWCAEGGQSCTGALLAHILETHPAHEELVRLAAKQQVSHFEYLGLMLDTLMMKRQVRNVLELSRSFFLYGDFHGNRSPLADPSMRATVIGQSMDVSIESLAVEYLAACEFIALQTRQIVETMVRNGHVVECVYMSGGQCRNSLLMQLIADSVGVPVVLPKYTDCCVVFGAALLACCASKGCDGIEADQSTRLWDIMTAMTPMGTRVLPNDDSSFERKYMDAKYGIFLDMIERQKLYRSQMDQVFRSIT